MAFEEYRYESCGLYNLKITRKRDAIIHNADKLKVRLTDI